MKNQSATGTRGPGEMLCRKREALGWSVQQIAESLRLSRAQIEAIEADDFGSLPGRTYVLGYWKNYSRLLDIPFDDVIAANKEKLRESNAGISLDHEYRDQRVKGDRSRRRAATLIGLLLVGFLAGVWYFKNGGRELERFALSPSAKTVPEVVEEEPVATLASDAAVATPPAIGHAETIEPVLESEGGGENEQDFSSQVAGTLPPSVPRPNMDDKKLPLSGELQSSPVELAAPNSEQTGQAGETSVESQVKIQLAPQSSPQAEDEVAAATPMAETATSGGQISSAEEAAEEAVSVAESSLLDLDSWSVTDTGGGMADEAAAVAVEDQQTAVVEQPDAISEPLSTAEPKVQPTRLTIAKNPDQVTVTAFKKTWLDVRDAENKRLVNRTVPRGAVLKLSGKPPFSFFVGSPDGVHVVYGGRVVRYRADTSDKFARFSVGIGSR